MAQFSKNKSTWSRPAPKSIRVDSFANFEGKFGVILRCEAGNLISAQSGELSHIYTVPSNQMGAASIGVTHAQAYLDANRDITTVYIYNENIHVVSWINDAGLLEHKPPYWPDYLINLRQHLVRNGRQVYFAYQSSKRSNEAAQWLAHYGDTLNIPADNVPARLTKIINTDKASGLFWPLRKDSKTSKNQGKDASSSDDQGKDASSSENQGSSGLSEKLVFGSFGNISENQGSSGLSEKLVFGSFGSY